jgi:hypothetical protein
MATMLKRSLSVLALVLVVCASGSAFATKKKPGKKAVPEFDGKAGGAAAALLIGGVAVLAERKRRKDKHD